MQLEFPLSVSPAAGVAEPAALQVCTAALLRLVDWQLQGLIQSESVLEVLPPSAADATVLPCLPAAGQLFVMIRVWKALQTDFEECQPATVSAVHGPSPFRIR